MSSAADGPIAHLGGRWAWDLQEVSHDPAVLDGTGTWAVALPYAGAPVLLRFGNWSAEPPEHLACLQEATWQGPHITAWNSSMSRSDYCQAVEATRACIAAGTIYQANICRILSAEMPPSGGAMAGLFGRLRVGNPAPYLGFVDAAEAGIRVATASPELFLQRDGSLLRTGPIKGTAPTVEGLLPKDWAENVMIVDLMRNDLGRVCQTGSVRVPTLTEVQAHPGLVHLVSRVEGILAPDATWPMIIDATFPPGSVTGAPKSSALKVIDSLEPAGRELYCGAIGWVDADRQLASLAVAIRTFWLRDGLLRFGTGAGITWESHADGEWLETQLKARHLVALSAGQEPANVAGFDA